MADLRQNNRYFDQLMRNYYDVLANAYTAALKDAATTAIKHLAGIPKGERAREQWVADLMDVVNNRLGPEFKAELAKPTKLFTQDSFQLGFADAKIQAGVSIGLYGVQQERMESILNQQNAFWVGSHFGADVSERLKNVVSDAVLGGKSSADLAKSLQAAFTDVAGKGLSYWQGMAEHTALKMREFGRLQGYKKAKATGYRLVVVIDDRTSDICLALAAEDKVYPLDTALEVMDNLIALDPDKVGVDEARAYVQAVSPWISDSQVVYNENDEPIGISGAATPFPPFHWRCRTTTEIVL